LSLGAILGEHRGDARVEFGSVGDQSEDLPVCLSVSLSQGCEIGPETVRG
jgi:hypothetical protein